MISCMYPEQDQQGGYKTQELDIDQHFRIPLPGAMPPIFNEPTLGEERSCRNKRAFRRNTP
jgi:hypothetical protein